MKKNLNNSKDKNKILIVFMLILLLLDNNFLYLINVNIINIGGKFNLNDISLSLTILFLLYDFLKKRRKIKFKFNKFIYFLILLIIIESFNSYYIYGQSTLLGFRAQRSLLIYLLYFPLTKELSINENNIKILEKLLMYFGFIAALLYNIQYLLIKKYLFLYVDISQRFGDNRLRFDSTIILISLFFIISNIINKRSLNKNLYFLLLIIEMYYFIFVSKGRMALFGIIFSVLIIIFVQKKYSKLYLLIIGVIAICLMSIFSISKMNIFNDYLEMTTTEISNKSGNYLVRLEEIKYYMNEFCKTPLLGRGVFNKLFDQSYYFSGLNNRYYLSDIGIFGFIYNYGVFGLIWLILFLKKLLKIISINLDKYFDYGVLGYLIFSIVTVSTLFEYTYHAFYFAILLSIINSYCILNNKEVKRNNGS